jgi:RND superfamily putative drug exporter
VLTFSVLFGLSMDYEVYPVSRIQEEWHRLCHENTSDLVSGNNHAIEIGQGRADARSRPPPRS